MRLCSWLSIHGCRSNLSWVDERPLLRLDRTRFSLEKIERTWINSVYEYGLCTRINSLDAAFSENGLCPEPLRCEGRQDKYICTCGRGRFRDLDDPNQCGKRWLVCSTWSRECLFSELHRKRDEPQRCSMPDEKCCTQHFDRRLSVRSRICGSERESTMPWVISLFHLLEWNLEHSFSRTDSLLWSGNVVVQCRSKQWWCLPSSGIRWNSISLSLWWMPLSRRSKFHQRESNPLLWVIWEEMWKNEGSRLLSRCFGQSNLVESCRRLSTLFDIAIRSLYLFSWIPSLEWFPSLRWVDRSPDTRRSFFSPRPSHAITEWIHRCAHYFFHWLQRRGLSSNLFWSRSSLLDWSLSMSSERLFQLCQQRMLWEFLKERCGFSSMIAIHRASFEHQYHRATGVRILSTKQCFRKWGQVPLRNRLRNPISHLW